jgi:negative regulator of sigma E activity
MGATLAEAQAAMNTLATTEASPTHPARDTRLVSIAKGWKKAGGTISRDDTGESTATMARADNNPPAPAVAAEVYFNASPGDEFYVTSKMNLVKVSDSRVLTIGKVARSDNDRYPYIIYDDNGTRLFVHYSGTIINRNGRAVGQMKAMTAN